MTWRIIAAVAADTAFASAGEPADAVVTAHLVLSGWVPGTVAELARRLGRPCVPRFGQGSDFVVSVQ